MNRYLVKEKISVGVFVEDAPIISNVVTYLEIQAHDEFEAYRKAKIINPHMEIEEIVLLVCEPNEWTCNRCPWRRQ